MEKRNSKPRISDLTFEVLEDELAEDIPLHLGSGELSFRVNGIYHRLGIKLKEPIYPKQIINAMSQVKKVASKKGYTISTLRKKQLPNTESKSNEVMGWRLATHFDKPYITEDVHVRQNLRDNLDASIERDLMTAQKKGILQPEEVLKLRTMNNRILDEISST